MDTPPDDADHVCHIRHPLRERAGTAWCGHAVAFGEWAFTGLDHAAANALRGGRLQACRHCVGAACAALGEASYNGGMNTPTPAQVEKYIEAADLELGPECSDPWVAWCRRALREARARTLAFPPGTPPAVLPHDLGGPPAD